MKDRLFILILFVILSLLPPAIPRKTGSAAPERTFPDSFTVLITETGELRSMSARDYLIGCLAAQIPLDYCQQALCAQAAASYTYALKLTDTDIPLSDDRNTGQAFFTPEKCAEIYGEDYQKYLPALTAAAEYGAARPITYEGEPIYAVYHSVSAGRTCSAYGVWGRELPYLKPADSFADRNYVNFECVNEMTAEQARLAVVKAKSDIETPADYGKWFSDLNANEDGYVISVRIGENLFSGGDIWRIFGLRSTAFTVSYSNGIFTFTTKGYGHGAGLSQFGANEMAKEGKTAEEILTHYYGENVKIG